MKKTVPFLLLVVLFAVAVLYSFIKQPDPVHELPPPDLPAEPVIQVPQAEPAVEKEVVEIEQEPVVIAPPLPNLVESDPSIKQGLAEVTGADAVTEYLVKDQVISRFVAAIDSLTSRQVPPQTNPVKPVDGEFMSETDGEKTLMSTANFARYDAYVDMLQRLDSDALVSFYRAYYPLYQEAWEGIGGEGDFNDRLLAVIDHLLGTPDIPGPVYLTKPEAVYLFESPELEAMTAGQKILVRMGSANAALVKEKLAKIRTDLTL